jgi:hypothetical protein
MKKLDIFVFLFIGGLFSVSAADIIVLKDGNMIDAKIVEIHPGEIRYKRADNLNGPTIVLLKDRVLSIRFESGVLEIVSASPPPAAQPAPPIQTASPPAAQQSGQTAGAGSSGGQQMGVQTALQTTLQASLLNTLNGLPAISIAGNNLKFQFGGDNWTALLNGENFMAGTVEVEDTDGGSILTLKQTHIWPGAAGKKVGKLASKLPGGAVAGSALNAAGSLAGAIEASGPVIVLEYKAGPPAKLSYLRSDTVASTSSPVRNTTVTPAAAPVQTVSGSTGQSPENPAPPDPTYIMFAGVQWRAEGSVAHPLLRSYPTIQLNITNEKINKRVQEVLTLKVNMKGSQGWALGQLFLESQTLVQQLQRGSGVQFKVLGDGKPWELRISTQEESKLFFYRADIASIKGKVVEINIPLSKLQPIDTKVSLQKENITGLHLQIRSNTGKPDVSTIKVFDFEIY